MPRSAPGRRVRSAGREPHGPPARSRRACARRPERGAGGKRACDVRAVPRPMGPPRGGTERAIGVRFARGATAGGRQIDSLGASAAGRRGDPAPGWCPGGNGNAAREADAALETGGWQNALAAPRREAATGRPAQDGQRPQPRALTAPASHRRGYPRASGARCSGGWECLPSAARRGRGEARRRPPRASSGRGTCS